jgi:SAM-dependent methyltransferase
MGINESQSKLQKVQEDLKRSSNYLHCIKLNLQDDQESQRSRQDCQKPLTQKPFTGDWSSVRVLIANQYIEGEGIEIGALHSPLTIPATANVKYVDRMSTADLRSQYPELNSLNLTEVDIIDDGESLGTISKDSLNFAISNHVIEHCQNPILTLINHLRVLKIDGIVYLAVPDKRYTFDIDRPPTSLEHLIEDYKSGSERSKHSHFEEYVRLVEKVAQEEIANRVSHLLSINYSIHFHVWTPTEFFELLIYCQKEMKIPFEIELFKRNNFEFIFILRKVA